MKWLVLFVLALQLTACGGGGGGSAGTPTPAGTTVSLTAFKGVFLGTAAGSQYSFPAMFGSDTLGHSYSGSYAVIADGATTFESQNVTKVRSLVTLQVAGGSAASGTTTLYYQVSDGTLYKSVSSYGITYTPTSQTPLPSSAKVGDSGAFVTVSGSDGTTSTTTWALNADYNGASRLVISSVEKTGSTVTSTEADTYYLDAAGNPTKVAISVTTSGVTVNLSGSIS